MTEEEKQRLKSLIKESISGSGRVNDQDETTISIRGNGNVVGNGNQVKNSSGFYKWRSFGHAVKK